MPQQDTLHSLQWTSADFDARPNIEIAIRLGRHSCGQSVAERNDFRFRQGRGNTAK